MKEKEGDTDKGLEQERKRGIFLRYVCLLFILIGIAFIGFIIYKTAIGNGEEADVISISSGAFLIWVNVFNLYMLKGERSTEDERN